MSLLQQINEWSVKHNPRWLVFVRVTLGISLFVKGFSFIRNNSILAKNITDTFLSTNVDWLTTVIPSIHLLGGSMIIAGLFTRLAALIQIPILLGAVFIVNVKKGLLAPESDLLFSIIILVLLLFFLIEGGGRMSLDHYFAKSRHKVY